MQLGWIDFSKKERGKVLDVINLLSEDGTLDELGIAPIRDGFANVFFPGTSTIQTRAKYFLIVPYALADLERGGEINPKTIQDKLDAIERSCAEIMLRTGDEGIIGKRSLKNGHWVKRAPSAIYWAGIRKYGIFTNSSMSLDEYIRASCSLKSQKDCLKKLGNRRDDSEENECDDSDAGSLFSTQFWKLPAYARSSWLDNVRIELSPAEARFLKTQIIEKCRGSLLEFILSNNRRDFLEIQSFDEVEETSGGALPKDIRQDFILAKAFSDFIYGARIRYNMILSSGQNESANREWEAYYPQMAGYAKLDIQDIFKRLLIFNPMLKSFLLDIRAAMSVGNIPDLDRRIICRERQLKGDSRAKLLHPGEFDLDVWIGGRRIDYRFNSAIAVVRDIFDGECDKHAEACI